MNNEYLMITASGEDRQGLFEQFAGRIADSGCNIEESSMSVIGGQFSLIAKVAGPWHALSKLEVQIEALAAQPGLVVRHQRIGTNPKTAAIPYSVEVITMDKPAVPRRLATFFVRNGINIEALHISTYPAPHTGTPLTSIVMTVGIHGKIHIPTLRGDFLDLCDDLNLDATLEPIRG